MKPPHESKEDRFRRLAEARVNKIQDLLRLLGNLSWTGCYAYSSDQVEQIFSFLQTELENAKDRFIQARKQERNAFSLRDSQEPTEERKDPGLVLPLPDGTSLRAVGYPSDSYPSINIYWDNGVNDPTEVLCFVEYNPEKQGCERVCIGAYCSDKEDTIYYAPYQSAERTTDE